MIALLVADVKNEWSIQRADRYHWEAWIKDDSDSQTGAPLLVDANINTLLEKIQAYELGEKNAST